MIGLDLAISECLTFLVKQICHFQMYLFYICFYRLCTDTLIFIPPHISILINKKRKILFLFVPNIRGDKMVMVQNISRKKKITFYFTIVLDQYLAFLYGGS